MRTWLQKISLNRLNVQKTYTPVVPNKGKIVCNTKRITSIHVSKQDAAILKQNACRMQIDKNKNIVFLWIKTIQLRYQNNQGYIYYKIK